MYRFSATPFNILDVNMSRNLPITPGFLRLLVTLLIFIASASGSHAAAGNSAAAANAKLPDPPVESINAINPAELRMHLEFLASRELGGRYTLSPNFAIAARYLASRLQAYGFRGAGANGSFLQSFDVVSTKTDTEKSSLTLQTKSEKLDYRYGDFLTFNSGAGAVEGPIVFVGYGISSASQEHDDYANLDVKGKIVLRVSAMPREIDPSKLGTNEQGEAAARAHGAIGELIVSFRGNSATPRLGEPRTGARESVHLARDAHARLPSAVLTPVVADKLLSHLNTSYEILKATRGEPLSPKPLEASAKLTVALNENRSTTQNVAGIFDGADAKLKFEFVTVSAHYDHLKTNAGGEFYPGADDDGSGTTSVLAIARAMSLQRPKRSILVIFHASEELGLLGSEYNTDVAPVVPLANTVVDLNIDMIGRSHQPGDESKANEQLTDANTIYPIGADRISSELHQIEERTNSDFEKLKLDYSLNDPKHPDRIYFRSDHWNYAKHGVPIIFFFDGVSVDYHQPTDTVDKIDFTKMTRVARLVYEIAWRVANLDHRLSIDKPVSAAN